MNRTPSVATRIVRSLVALVTVWCLGCSGYEPLLDALLGTAGKPISCSEMIRSSESVTSAASTTSVAAMSASHESFDCGCGQGCHASSPAIPTAQPIGAALPALASLEVSTPPSETRTPPLPPPEAAHR
jgi:hypothetical protein